MFAELRENSISVKGPEVAQQLIIADLDLSMIDRECMSLDVSGHYARPDVFSFSHRTIK